MDVPTLWRSVGRVGQGGPALVAARGDRLLPHEQRQGTPAPRALLEPDLRTGGPGLGPLVVLLARSELTHAANLPGAVARAAAASLQLRDLVDPCLVPAAVERRGQPQVDDLLRQALPDEVG